MMAALEENYRIYPLKKIPHGQGRPRPTELLHPYTCSIHEAFINVIKLGQHCVMQQSHETHLGPAG
jgi:hypothetical protein